MNTPLTIDNYPHEVYNRWAHDQIDYDPTLLKDSSLIRSQAEIGVSKPIYLPARQALFEEDEKIRWSFISAPPNFFTQSNRFFASQIFPNLQLDQILETLEDFAARKKEFSSLISEQFKSIQAFIECIHLLSEWLREVRARIQQYSKG